MAVRDDVNVNFNTSPRIITIAAPSTSITLQDLVDTLRQIEADQMSMDDAHLIDASGKEDLTGGVFVGITGELQNAQLQFEGRLTSVTSGTVTTTDTDGIILTDSGASFTSLGLEAGDMIINLTDGSITYVIQVLSDTRIQTAGLADGSDNQWDSGDTYKIWQTEECTVQAGNTVAVDDGGATIKALLGAPGVSAVVAQSVSAALLNPTGFDDLVSAVAFLGYENGAVWIDPVNGDDSASGRATDPVKTAGQAKTVAAVLKTKRIHLQGWLTLDTTLAGYQVYGGDQYNTGIDFNGYSVAASTFYDLICWGSPPTGLGEGYVAIRCFLYSTAGGVGNLNGAFVDCAFGGREIDAWPVESNVAVSFENCYFAGTGTLDPNRGMRLDLSATAGPYDVHISKWAGELQLANLATGNVWVHGSGSVAILASCTGGKVKVQGSFELFDNSATGCNVVDERDAQYEPVDITKRMAYHDVTLSGDTAIIYEADKVTVWKKFDLTGGGRQEI
jgi:hypothetical protein